VRDRRISSLLACSLVETCTASYDHTETVVGIRNEYDASSCDPAILQASLMLGPLIWCRLFLTVSDMQAVVVDL
jgi:hypothetical protein